jgi:hypothetical protein
MHTIRLLQSVEQILAMGNLTIKVFYREALLFIKAGEKEYDDLLQLAYDLMLSIANYSQTNTLPEHPDEQKPIDILVEIREELYGGENRK